MRPIWLTVGMLVVGFGGALAFHMATREDTAPLKRGAAYRFYVDDEGSITPEALANYGWTSMTLGDAGFKNKLGNEMVVVQAIWGGPDNTTWIQSEWPDMTEPVYLETLA